MKVFLLAITAALAVAGGLYMTSSANASSRLLTQESAIENAFASWRMKYGKTYGTAADAEYRKSVFANWFHYVNEHNSTPGVSFTVGLNEFADLTNEEFRAQKTTLKARSADYVSENVYQAEELSAPASFDWRQKGSVTDVKNQGSCGSCWSFSTTGALEGAYKAKHGQLVSISEQQFVDCDRAEDQGCNGGLMDNAFKYAQTHAFEKESDYPYTATDGTCKADSSKGIGKVSKYTDVGHDDASFVNALSQRPLAVAVDASAPGWQLYFGGIMKPISWNPLTWGGCTSRALDHGVLAVAYDADSYTIKNSWGSGWGEHGYIRLARGTSGNGTCMVRAQASYPELA